MMPERVDYVIVGAGTAGCVLAGRLSEDPDVRVALLEAGGSDHNPAIWDTNIDAQRSLWAPTAAENWGYGSVPQPGLQGRAIPIARGKVVGGCSAVNAMIYIRGNRRDFDGWSRLGNRGWSYSEVLPYFKKSERYHGPASEWHGRDGPVSVVDYAQATPAAFAFVEATAELGHSNAFNDFNGPSQEGGAGFCQSTRTPRNVRVTAASAYVTPNRQRANLQLLTDVRATRVLFERGRAVGVAYATRAGLDVIHAEREVVLCCGAFETPKLMLLSGLGPAAELARHGISVVQEIAGVGNNLQDHLLLGVGFESKVPLAAPNLLAEAGLFTWTPNASPLLSPNLQFFFVSFQFVAADLRAAGSGFTLIPILAQPQSRGTVTLASSDPAALARIDPCYLSRDEDVAVFEHGIRYARELAHCRPFGALRGREVSPGVATASRSELRDYIRRAATTVWHPSGTCKMGAGEDAVVDDELRVRGVEGLRIVDASIMPGPVSGNPNAAVMMIAERAAALMMRRRSEPAQGERAHGDARREALSVNDECAVSTPFRSAPPVMGGSAAPSLASYRDRVEPLLRRAIAERHVPRSLYDRVAERLSRLESGLPSAICLATCRALGGSEARALPLAAGLELVRGGLLAHETIGADGPARAVTSGRSDVPTAVAVGDVMRALGTRLFRHRAAELDAAHAERLSDELAHIVEQSVEGRPLDLDWANMRGQRSAEAHYLSSLLKTAGWAGFIAPARIGALLARPDGADLDRFNRFGYFLALAFQIRDELRRLVVRPRRPLVAAGQPGVDPRLTLALAHLLDGSAGEERRRLEALLGQPPTRRSPRELAWLDDALRAHGSVAHARDAARRFSDQARDELELAYADATEPSALDFLRSLPLVALEFGPVPAVRHGA